MSLSSPSTPSTTPSTSACAVEPPPRSEQIWLTASGGPFRNTPIAEFEHITPQQALKHPTWVMGQRITIDSATMMNKGFEVIEACRLFNLPAKQVRTTIHPQSTVHSLVEFVDGSILAQISVTDMRLPILYALAYPERVAVTEKESLTFDLTTLSANSTSPYPTSPVSPASASPTRQQKPEATPASPSMPQTRSPSPPSSKDVSPS